MPLAVETEGTTRCLYDESLNLAVLGSVQNERGCHEEPDSHGRWFADLSPVGGPLLGLFSERSDALDAEARWRAAHWLEVQVRLQTH